MEQYISKSALVAWIKSRLLPTINSNADEFERGEDNERIQTLNFINNLEVREVDLDDEIDREWEDSPIPTEYWLEFERLCKHFFELGLKAQKGEEV